MSRQLFVGKLAVLVGRASLGHAGGGLPARPRHVCMLRRPVCGEPKRLRLGGVECPLAEGQALLPLGVARKLSLQALHELK